jgi:muramoyltetrapeptide carboxypeptidase
MRLTVGDEVALVAPAARLRGRDEGLHAQGVALLESWGLRVRVLVPSRGHFYLAGTDQERVAGIHEALGDDAIRALFCLRGGYGSPRLLPLLDPNLRVADKLLVGYSDITALHGAVARLWPSMQLIYGPNLATHQLLAAGSDADLTRESLHRVLFSDPSPTIEPVDYVHEGQGRGPLVGGCLTMVAGLLGGPSLPAAAGRVVLLEDTGESPYRVDRMLTQLRNAEFFAGAEGVVFGRMPKCEDGINSLGAVIEDVLGPLGIPIAIGFRTGHGDVNLSVRLGAETTLDSASGVVSVV